MQQYGNDQILYSPSDLVTFLGCHHASFLDVKALSEDMDKAEASTTGQLLQQKGLEHEAAYLQQLKDEGKAICPKEPWKQDVQLSAGRKAISEFKKANGNLSDLLSLMFYYVKCGNDFTLEFGDIDESFYDSMESMFARLVQTLIKQKDKTLASQFLPQLAAEFKRVEWMGWGYGDGLRELLNELTEAFPDISEAAA